VLPLSKRYHTSPCYVVHLLNWPGYSLPCCMSWRQQSGSCSKVLWCAGSTHAQALGYAFAKRVRKPPMGTAYHKMLLEIPCQDFSSFTSVQPFWTHFLRSLQIIINAFHSFLSPSVILHKHQMTLRVKL